MAISQIIKQHCKVCGKVAVEKSRIQFADSRLITLECGHITSEDVMKERDYSAVVSLDGKRLMPYQIDGVKFAEQSNGRCLIADEQGLGKTIQAAAFLALHPDETYPIIVVTKTTIKAQWAWELIRWMKIEKSKVQVINSSKELALPGYEVYVTTYDMLKDEKVFSLITPKTLVLDECQAIKNHLSGRAKAVQKVSEKCEHILGLSGTPIKNNAGEYFTILNILQPKLFPEYNRFITRWCDSYSNMYGYKVGGLSRPDEFRELTKDFVIRRTKAEVLPDLPELSRRFYHVELGKKFQGAYEQASKELEELYYQDEDDNTGAAMIAVMTRMRKITGLSKVTECVEFVADHVVSTGRKITVFTHHHSVMDLLQIKLNEYLKPLNYAEVMRLDASMDSTKRAAVVRDFESNECKVLLASTLAAGEGLNLQFISDAVMLERQWNPANEEQAEARFHRFGQKNPVTVTYMIADGCIDEYFTELVEQKRAIVASTLDNKSIEWETSSLMKELASIIVSKGSKRWTL